MVFKAIVSKEKPLIIPIFIPHKGCDQRCYFCDQTLIAATSEDEVVDIEKTVQQYLQWKGERQTVELSFYGGSFTAIDRAEMNHFIDEAKHLVAGGLVDYLRCSTRPDAITEEIAEILFNNGFKTVELGVQTFSDALLSGMNRSYRAKSVVEALKTLREKGLKVVFQLMTGYPGETEDDILQTARFVSELKPDAIRIYPFVLLPNTKIEALVSSGKKHLVDTTIVLDRSAALYLAAQKAVIPVIRVGLPPSTELPLVYPENLAQVVITKMLEKLIQDDEDSFILPRSWETSWNMITVSTKNISVQFRKIV